MSIEEGQQYTLKVETTLTFSKVDGRVNNRVITNLLTGKNLDIRQYYQPENGILNEAGYKIMTELLIQGLNVNIQGAHQQGKIDSAKHLRQVISRLEDLFVNISDVSYIPANSIGIDD